MKHRMKITIFGAGQVGATAAFLLAREGLADIMLIDAVEGLARGKAEDIRQSLAITSSPVDVRGGSDPALCSGSDLVVIAAGSPRRVGMQREDLLRINLRVVRDIMEQVQRHAPQCIVLVVSNPVDLLTQAALEASGWPRSRILGLSGQLDAHRMRRFVADALSVALEDVQAQVIGTHSDDMLILPRLCTVKGMPLTGLLSKEHIDELCKATRHAGMHLIELTGNVSPYFSAASTITEMARGIVQDTGRVVNASVRLEGEYGLHGACVALPVRLGFTGIQGIFQPELQEDERSRLERAVQHARELLAPHIKSGQP